MPRNYKNIIVRLLHDLNQVGQKVRKRLRAMCVLHLCPCKCFPVMLLYNMHVREKRPSARYCFLETVVCKRLHLHNCTFVLKIDPRQYIRYNFANAKLKMKN